MYEGPKAHMDPMLRSAAAAACSSGVAVAGLMAAVMPPEGIEEEWCIGRLLRYDGRRVQLCDE